MKKQVGKADITAIQNSRGEVLTDSFERSIEYMRVSITDRCNLRCKYCMPEDMPYVPHENIMRYEEILRLCSIMAGLGIKTVRVTGGEPLVRKGCVDFLRRLKAISGIERISLTTNATLLGSYVPELASLGLHGVNISLDSLSSEIYRKITGSDMFEDAWSGIEKALHYGLRVKLNCVPIAGVNESGIVPLAALAREYPISVRFIELMPTGANAAFKGIPSEEVFNMISSEFNLSPDENVYGFGPAKYFKSAGLKGNIGLISALSDNFCSSCNRVRLSAEGHLKLCLHHNHGIDLRTMCRSGASDAEIIQAVKDGMAAKPKEHTLHTHTDLKHMSRIGG